jgi:ribosomal protein L12E/L44/L45/RPP1/RPP2
MTFGPQGRAVPVVLRSPVPKARSVEQKEKQEKEQKEKQEEKEQKEQKDQLTLC